jgi:hypothetical protein
MNLKKSRTHPEKEKGMKKKILQTAVKSAHAKNKIET